MCMIWLSVFPLRTGEWICVCVPEPRVQCWYAAYFLCWQRESIFIKWLMFLFLQEKNKKRWKNRYKCRKWQRSKYWSLQVCSQKLKICLHVPSWLCLISLWRWPVLVDSLSVREENCLVAGRKVTQRTWPHRGPTPCYRCLAKTVLTHCNSLHK